MAAATTALSTSVGARHDRPADCWMIPGAARGVGLELCSTPPASTARPDRHTDPPEARHTLSSTPTLPPSRDHHPPSIRRPPSPWMCWTTSRATDPRTPRDAPKLSSTRPCRPPQKLRRWYTGQASCGQANACAGWFPETDRPSGAGTLSSTRPGCLAQADSHHQGQPQTGLRWRRDRTAAARWAAAAAAGSGWSPPGNRSTSPRPPASGGPGCSGR